MASTVTIDLRQVARGLNIPLRQVQTTVELLDEGNTVPFITRYRKDQTGGLDEEQVREIQARLAKMRLLADRKQTILRSIDSQGKLTEKLAKQILSAPTTKRLEDLYLPFKPKKQTLATLARSRGLEEFAHEILDAAPLAADLDARAADFISTDRQIPTAADALLGAGHILAEHFSEDAELRQRLRGVFQRTGVLISVGILGESKAAPDAATAASEAVAIALPADVPPSADAAAEVAAQPSNDPPPAIIEPAAEPLTVAAEAPAEDQPSIENTEAPQAEAPQAAVESQPADGSQPASPSSLLKKETGSEPSSENAAKDNGSEAPVPLLQQAATAEQAPPGPSQRKLARAKAKQEQQKKREAKKKKLEEKRIKAFRDYFDYRDELQRLPPHRILAINRGERARVLRVKIECNVAEMTGIIDEMLVPPGHPHADYLRGCAHDALSRLILPSLERDIRREMTDRAEAHAVGVFARNLRNLLLQPPVHNHRVLAVDPGFKSGCKLAALDQFGNLLEHAVMFLIGKPEQREEARKLVIDLIERHQLTVAAIGNGTACRETEDFFAELVEQHFKEQGLAYVIVNEAGASVYSISRVGREELPECDAGLRGAISIGRRLEDPLSELVKIDPANIGVGLYQHDVKAKHLEASLDHVVESCVNYVGVDVNTASPALLRYVSGLNQLTARRLYEHRREHGPFRTREQLREVPGLGEATFVQAAGFLKIPAGDNPLDATWIHPESYAVANRVLERLHGSPTDLREKDAVAALAERVAQVDLESLATELEVGILTLKDILAQLARPGRDPREDLPAPVFKRGIIKLEDLAVRMELTGTVLNVVDFGCFVDIGMHDSGLVHVSRMADRFIRDPHDLVAVGDIVRVWVYAVDKERRRVSLTMIPPGTQRGRPPRPSAKPADAESAGTRPEGQEPAAEGPRPPRRDRQQRPGQGRPSRPAGDGQPQRSGRPPRSHGAGRPRPPHHVPPPPRPKPLIPITEAMKEGKEPLRTFGDLIQFYQYKTQDGKPAAAEPVQATVAAPASVAVPPAVEQAVAAVDPPPAAPPEEKASE